MGSGDGERATTVIPGGFINPEPDDIYAGQVPVAYEEVIPYGLPLTARHRRVAELIAQNQLSDAEVADRTGYSAEHIRAFRQHPRLRSEVEKYRDKIFEKTIPQQLTDASSEALRTIVEMINDPNQKLRDRTDAAKWVIEMVDGKAKQKVSHEAGSSILELINKLDQFAASGDDGRPVLEIEGKAAEEEDWMKTWVRENVPVLESEKTLPAAAATEKTGEQDE